MRVLSEVPAEAFLEREGFPVAERYVVHTLAEAKAALEKLGPSVVLKVASDTLVHKSDVNAVRLNVHAHDLVQAFRELQQIKVAKEGVLVQRQSAGKAILIGIKKDPTFGHVLVVGMGGIYTEVVKDVAMRILPITSHDALQMLKDLKGFKILKGYRGEHIDIVALVQIMLKTARLAEHYPHIQELDINPLIVNEKGAKIVDARIVFED